MNSSQFKLGTVGLHADALVIDASALLSTIAMPRSCRPQRAATSEAGATGHRFSDYGADGPISY